jgi:hypothetical protein
MAPLCFIGTLRRTGALLPSCRPAARKAALAGEYMETLKRGTQPVLGGVMEWFSQKTSIAGVQVSNWMIVLGAIIIVLLIYSSMH